MNAKKCNRLYTYSSMHDLHTCADCSFLVMSDTWCLGVNKTVIRKHRVRQPAISVLPNTSVFILAFCRSSHCQYTKYHFVATGRYPNTFFKPLSRYINMALIRFIQYNFIWHRIDFSWPGFLNSWQNYSMIIFERKICVIAGTRTTDLQFSVLAP